MSQGRIQQVGEPQHIYDNPSNRFVATFLGSPSMNVLPYGGHEVGFRPESFVPTKHIQGSGGMRKFHYHVKRIEYLGSDRLLYGHLHDFAEDKLVLSRLPNNIPDEIDTEGPIEFAVAESNLFFFDTETGERLSASEVPEG
jgi:multiple sugar transport system ATP-binding protein